VRVIDEQKHIGSNFVDLVENHTAIHCGPSSVLEESNIGASMTAESHEEVSSNKNPIT